MASPISARRAIFGFALCALALSALAPRSRAADWESTVAPFSPGNFPEARSVRVEYGFGWSGISAATADIRFQKTADNRFQFEARGTTIGVARMLWRYDVVHTALVDAASLRPIRVREVENTRSKQLTTQLTFSSDGVLSEREERKAGKVETKKRQFEFSNLHSLNSALLFLRTKPLNAGAVYRVVVYPATSAYLCTVKFLGRERITVPAGSYDALKLDVVLSKIGNEHELIPHKKFRNAIVWLSDDADRLTLRIEAQVFVGSVFAELRSVQWDAPRP